MDQFKVNVSKEALEEFYGRELSGQEVETARYMVADAMADMAGKNRWPNRRGSYFSAYPWLGVFEECGVVQIFDGTNDIPERPLSDFLSEPSHAHIQPDRPRPKPPAVGERDEPTTPPPTSRQETRPDHPGLGCIQCKESDTCPTKKLLVEDDREIYDPPFYCADFRSINTGLGVRETIITDAVRTQERTGEDTYFNVSLPPVNEYGVTPNCALCRWLSKDNTMSGNPKCTACGYPHPSEAHNTPECKALYKVKE